MLYSLDANVVIALLKKHPAVWAELRKRKRREVGISAIVAHELFFGAFRSNRRDQTVSEFEALRFPILDFTDEDARKSGEIRAALAAAGTPIGPYDILIAGQALANGLTLVTRNTREFSRVAGLSVENWESGNP